ncbi:hypothetical protein bAD24_I11550 [Burkholderia sp. AD24]|nr:hypothetical protein bAD24_I11550 [Burkholderia sp. AD24]
MREHATQSRLTVNQCLFGYDDGHRMLACSVSLPPASASRLLVMSDLAPGITLSANSSYWTGFPVHGTKYYALMRTWGAPEMPRPGCVWTHALLLESTDMSRFRDMRKFAALVRHPGTQESLEEYTEAIHVDLSCIEYSAVGESSAVTEAQAISVIRALYGAHSKGKLEGPLGAFDAAIFAAWSQQWPRLRRAFSFRTVHSDEVIPNGSPSFALSVASPSGSGRRMAGGADKTDLAPWEKIAADDLRASEPSEFRRFLLRYGADIRPSRRPFSFLTQLYLATRSPLSPSASIGLLTKLSVELPEVDEGALLKADLVSNGPYSLLPRTDPLGILTFFTTSDTVSFQLSENHLDVARIVDESWNAQRQEIVRLARTALERDHALASKLVESVSARVSLSELFSDVSFEKEFRKAVLLANPNVAEEEQVQELSESQFSEFAAFVPALPDSVLLQILPALVCRDHAQLAELLWSRQANATVAAVVYAMRRKLAGHADGAARSSWIDTLGRDRTQLLQSGLIQTSESTAEMVVYAYSLNLDSREVLDCGVSPWAVGLANCGTDSAEGHNRDILLSFLVALAIERPARGCEKIFEFALPSVYKRLKQFGFPEAARGVILRHLSPASWLEEWDVCKRLARAVAFTYRDAGLDPGSLSKLMQSDEEMKNQLSSTLKATSVGRRLLREATGRPLRRLW